MSRSLTIVYDDREAPPVEIESIIGSARFSEILHRRISLGETIRREVRRGGASDFFHLLDPRDAKHLAELAESGSDTHIFLLLPSSFMPTNPEGLANLVAKAAFALRSTFAMKTTNGEGPVLLLRNDLVALLRAPNPATAREILLHLSQQAPAMLDHCGFVDLRQPDAFIDFINGATESRHFNAIRIDRHVFSKTSTDRDKMAREYAFFGLAPERMKPFLITSFDFFDDGARAGYSTERLAVPDAALQLIHRAFDEGSFGALVETFFAFLAARPVKPMEREGVRAVARDAILGKMHQRLDLLLTTAPGRRLDALLVEAGPYGGIASMRERAAALIEAAIARDPSDALAFGHGDPCLSNILFDRRTRLFRLIDPRGARNEAEAWMHPLYDLAKFSHSVLGGYDFVNNDLFECSLDAELKFVLRLHDDGPPASFRAILERHLAETGLDLGIVRAYELSLFMSMMPLHIDHPRKLAGFAMLAARIIRELEA